MSEQTIETGTAFDRLTEAVRNMANLEGYVDASREDIDTGAKEMREAFTEFCALPGVIAMFGVERATAAVEGLDEDTRRCGNCGTVDCENEECEGA